MNVTSDYIHRWFTMVAKTKNFLKLDFDRVNKILSSSELCISSELEIYHAGDLWLSCEHSDRVNFAKSLFLKIRFPLLSDHATQHVLQN